MHNYLLIALWVLFVGLCSAQKDHEHVLLWSSTGGGWRAMFADIGFANIFQQAGLFDENSTEFSGIVRTNETVIKPLPELRNCKTY